MNARTRSIAGLGAGLLGLLIPWSRRRRARAAAEAASAGPERVTDSGLRERIRGELRRISSRPDAIRVASSGRRVVLAGDVLGHEVPAILRAIVAMRGVTALRNEMTAHGSVDTMPAPQRVRQWRRGRAWRQTAAAALGSTAATALVLGIVRSRSARRRQTV